MKHSLLALAMTCCVPFMQSQGTLEDYNRAYEAPKKFSSRNVYYSNVRPVWLTGKPTFWYVRETPQGRRYVAVDAPTQKRGELFDHGRLSAALSSQTGVRISPDSIYLDHLRLSAKGDTLNFNHMGKVWQYAVKSGKLLDKGAIPETPQRPHWWL